MKNKIWRVLSAPLVFIGLLTGGIYYLIWVKVEEYKFDGEK